MHSSRIFCDTVRCHVRMRTEWDFTPTKPKRAKLFIFVIWLEKRYNNLTIFHPMGKDPEFWSKIGFIREPEFRTDKRTTRIVWHSFEWNRPHKSSLHPSTSMVYFIFPAQATFPQKFKELKISKNFQNFSHVFFSRFMGRYSSSFIEE